MPRTSQGDLGKLESAPSRRKLLQRAAAPRRPSGRFEKGLSVNSSLDSKEILLLERFGYCNDVLWK